MSIGGAIFLRQHVHKATWVSPYRSTQNEADHIYINKKFRRSVEDVTTRRRVANLQAFREIMLYIRKNNTGKAEGFDNKPAKTLKSDIEVTVSMFHALLKRI